MSAIFQAKYVMFVLSMVSLVLMATYQPCFLSKNIGDRGRERLKSD